MAVSAAANGGLKGFCIAIGKIAIGMRGRPVALLDEFGNHAGALSVRPDRSNDKNSRQLNMLSMF